MNHIRTLAVLSLSLIPVTASALNDRAAEVFQEARASIDRGDCAAALSLLENVKGRRTREPAFVEMLERARRCASRAEEKK